MSFFIFYKELPSKCTQSFLHKELILFRKEFERKTWFWFNRVIRETTERETVSEKTVTAQQQVKTPDRLPE